MKQVALSFFLLCSNHLFSQFQQINSALALTDLFDAKAKKQVACYRIPALATAPNGDLIAVVDERVTSCKDLRSNPDINIVVRRSTDNGNSWLPIETVVNYPVGQSASDPSLIVDTWTNEILLFFNYMDLKKEKHVYRFKMVKSKDNGRTWSQPVDITPQISKPEWQNDFKFITSGRGIQTTTGTLLHTLVHVTKGLYTFYSTNHGAEWHLTDVAIQPADESKIVELANSTLMINSRVNGAGYRFTHTSENMGLSWQTRADSALIDPGCNAGMIKYSCKNGKSGINPIIFSNPKNSRKRINMTVRISNNEGKSWSEGKTVYAGRAGYSSLSVLTNGEIGLLFEKDNGCSFTKFGLNWLTNSSDTLLIK